MPVAAYDEIAEWYDESLRKGALTLGEAALLELIADATGQRICDLGCGQGALARHLARRGARVVGVDLSARLLAIARRYEREEPAGIAYLQGDAQGLDGLRDAVFDGVVCSMALMDIADLDATLRAVARVLRPAGWFAFSITHPCFQIPPLGAIRLPDGTDRGEWSGYFAEGYWRSDNPDGVRGQVGAYHRTLATYLNVVADAGLMVERLIEPPPAVPDGQSLARQPQMPKVLVARCRKLGPSVLLAHGARLESLVFEHGL